MQASKNNLHGHVLFAKVKSTLMHLFNYSKGTNIMIAFFTSFLRDGHDELEAAN